jgi:hypothetical protein
LEQTTCAAVIALVEDSEGWEYYAWALSGLTVYSSFQPPRGVERQLFDSKIIAYRWGREIFLTLEIRIPK